LNVQKGKLSVTEHCGALGRMLTCSTTNISFFGQLNDDFPNELIQQLHFDEKCHSFTKMVREFDTQNICKLGCHREEVSKPKASIAERSDEFACTSAIMHADQSISRSKAPYKNIITHIDETFSVFENIETGFHEVGHCAEVHDQEHLCLTTNISFYDDPIIVSKLVYTERHSYKKYVRSVTNSSLFVGLIDCSHPGVVKTPQTLQCDPAGNYTCSGFCILSNEKTVNAPEFAIVEEVSPGLFYNVSSGRDSVVHDVIFCVYEDYMEHPAMSCVMSKKSGQDVRIVAFEEIRFHEGCNSMTRIVRDIIESPVCEFRCEKDESKVF